MLEKNLLLHLKEYKQKKRSYRSFLKALRAIFYVNMVRIELYLSAICLITQSFTLNINILHVVYVCIEWKRGLHDLWDMFMITSRRICLRSKEIILMDNDICLVMVKNTVLLWLLQCFSCVLMLKCNFWLTKQQWRLTPHNWQKWKSRFLICHCHKIYRVEAVGLSILYDFVNNCLIKVRI